jgi:uncharacterized membrane protein (DUF2068 family)
MTRTRDKGLLLISAFKLLRGIALLAVAAGAFNLLHRDMETVVLYWLDVLRIDPDNELFRHVVERLMALDDHQLKQIGAATFAYGSILLVESVGLFFEKRWAEFFTIIKTSCFIPFELYQIWLRFTGVKFAILIINLAIVAYLVHVVRKNPHRKRAVFAGPNFG